MAQLLSNILFANNTLLLDRTAFTATNNQVSFSTNYTAPFVEMFLNGVKLVKDVDFTASNGTSLNLTTGAAEGDVIEVVKFKAGNIYSAPTIVAGTNINGGGNLGGSNTVTLNLDTNVTGLTSLSSVNVTATGNVIAADVTASGNVNAAFFIGDGSNLTNAGSAVTQEVPDTATSRNLFVPFTGVTSGTMTSANVSVGLVFNPGTGTLTANSFVGDGSGLTGAGATLANDAVTNSDLNVVFTGLKTGALTTANVAEGVFTFNPSTGIAKATQFTATSDRTLKEDIETINGALDTVKSLRGVTYKWVNNKNDGLGLIAQELEEIVPAAVETDPKGVKSINYNALIGILVEAIKELSNRVDEK